jgi:hypothetical protein
MKSFILSKRIKLLFFYSYFLAISIGIFFSWLNDSYLHFNIFNPLENKSKFYQITIAVILTPIVETLIFQVLPNWALNKIKINKQIFLIVIPSLFFAIAHMQYHWLYGLVTFIGGIIINNLYVKSKKEFNCNYRDHLVQVNSNIDDVIFNFNPFKIYYFWLVVMFHGFYNLFMIFT